MGESAQHLQEDQGSAQARAGNEHLPVQSCSEGQMALANTEDEAVQPGQRSVCQPQEGCNAFGFAALLARRMFFSETLPL